jgi:release factor glutamine methyltransferase
MTVRTLLAQGCDTLTVAKVETPVLDALVLLAHAMEATKERLLAMLPDPVSDAEAARYRQMIDQRCGGEPVSYIRRIKEFYGLELYVDERVLVPRPDTEVLVDVVLRLARANPGLRRIHDACTGSGCIAIALKRAQPDLQVSASDISARAIEVALLNAANILGAPIDVQLSDLLDDVQGVFDVIASNPPYVSHADVAAMLDIGWAEPALALDGGAAGTEIAERLIRSAPAHLSPSGWLVMEASPGQFETLTGLMLSAGFDSIALTKDLGDRERVIAGRSIGGGAHA